MAIGLLDQQRKFITTEPLGNGGEGGEQKTWEAVQAAFQDRHCIGYWRYPIFSKVGKLRKEPDILIADAQLGLIIIEVKSVRIDQIVTITGHRWEFQNYYTIYSNPYQQAEHQLFALLGYCDREPSLRRKVTGRVLIGLPLITEKQWYERGFYQLPSCPPIIFHDHLISPGEILPISDLNSPLHNSSANFSLLSSLQKTPPLIKGTSLTTEQWQLLQAVISGTPVFRKKRPVRSIPAFNSALKPLQTRSSVLTAVRQHLSTFDGQYEHIGKEIPPGPQRIRGIAGSGKTALLCQKAAHMHLKHPDWDIAFVFFSRSLYESIMAQLDQWLRRFSGDEVRYNPKTLKLQILHAWGGKKQAGLYSQICQAVGVKPLTVNDTEKKQPNEALAEVCCQLLQNTSIPQLYDAIIIDEGQDLMVNDSGKFEDKQPFYWLAYQALRPIQSTQPEQRRLIWGYDEAQSLDSLNIPHASELFGDQLGHLVTGQYPGGIQKSEIMTRCYRTPGAILTAAHGIGMGLLRPGGLLTGISRLEDWQAIGYEVSGRCDPGQPMTIKRPPENSPNPVPQLWQGSVLEFIIYRDRQEELTALAERIFYTIRQDGLKPSQEILVIILGTGLAAMQLQTHVAEFLISQGIDIYIPSASDCNLLIPDPHNRNPNKFWCEGGVTVSRIHRAKGNEAEMVYIVGLDAIAKEESNVQLRNQLFVALTRSKGWVNLSGVGDYPMYEEMWRVIRSGDTFTFTVQHPPQREITVTDVGEMRSRYQSGGRNFQNADLAGVQLADADLRNANLMGANLQGADLKKAQLQGAKLVISDLSYADLRGANLRKAKLVGANLTAARLNDADLTGANLSGADLTGATLQGARLENVNLTGVILPDETVSNFEA